MFFRILPLLLLVVFLVLGSDRAYAQGFKERAMKTGKRSNNVIDCRGLTFAECLKKQANHACGDYLSSETSFDLFNPNTAFSGDPKECLDFTSTSSIRFFVEPDCLIFLRAWKLEALLDVMEYSNKLLCEFSKDVVDPNIMKEVLGGEFCDSFCSSQNCGAAVSMESDCIVTPPDADHRTTLTCDCSRASYVTSEPDH